MNSRSESLESTFRELRLARIDYIIEEIETDDQLKIYKGTKISFQSGDKANEYTKKIKDELERNYGHGKVSVALETDDRFTDPKRKMIRITLTQETDDQPEISAEGQHDCPAAHGNPSLESVGQDDSPNMKLSPTEIASYVRLECCERYLYLLAEEKNNSDGNGDRTRTTLDPWLVEKGEEHEKAFEEHLFNKLKIPQMCFSRSNRAYASSGEPLDCFVQEYRKAFYVRESQVEGEIEGLSIKGRIDFLVCLRGDGKNTIILVECKASVQDKTYQRIQAAVYALLLEKKLSEGEKKNLQVLVVRQSKATGKLHTYKIDGSKLILDPESQKDEPDDEEENLPSPQIDETELKALKEDIKNICEKIKTYFDAFAKSNGNEPDSPPFQLLPRCANCDFQKRRCLEDAKTRADPTKGDATNGKFGIELLAYHAKAAKVISKENSLDEVKNLNNTGIFPPPDKLVPVRQAYYLNGNNQSEVEKIDGRVPALPNPNSGNGNPFFQFFLCVEADPTNNGKLGAIALKTVKIPPGEDAERQESHVWTKWNGENGETNSEKHLLTSLIEQIKAEINGSEQFYAHFYFWSLSEKKLLAQACEREKENGGDIKGLLDWISRHPYLREPKKDNYGNFEEDEKTGLAIWGKEQSQTEELVCSQLQEEVRKCYALGSIGNTLLEVSCLNWPKVNGTPLTNWESSWCPTAVNWILDGYQKPIANACGVYASNELRDQLKKRLVYQDTLPPSAWEKDPAKDVLECYFKKRVKILQELEERVRQDFEGFPICKGRDADAENSGERWKVLNKGFPEAKKEESLVQAARNMLLIETMHEKDRWLKEATEGFQQMEDAHQSVKLENSDKKPQWRVW